MICFTFNQRSLQGTYADLGGYIIRSLERTSTRKEHIDRQKTLFNVINDLRLRSAVQNNTHKIEALLNAIENL